MRLIDKINHLRLHASFLFDLGKAKNMDPKEIGKTIKPLSDKLEKEINESSVKERVLAINSLNSQIEAHQLDQQLIQLKIEDTKDHINSLTHSLIKELQSRGTDSLIEDGYAITLIDGKLSIR